MHYIDDLYQLKLCTHVYRLACEWHVIEVTSVELVRLPPPNRMLVHLL